MGSASDAEERKVSVWVCREEKLVLGLSKRNTCGDVVKVLLQEQRPQPGLSAAQSYCIVEKWRGFERILPNKTKILKLWNAWGDERKNVRFMLVRADASMENHRARSAEARVVASALLSGGSPRSDAGCISTEKRRRVVRKAFRKLEKMNRRRARAAHRDASGAERMETLVHLVVSQDLTIRQQLERIAELDAHIDMREAEVHLDRTKRHGLNYVQNIYLVGAAEVAAQEQKGLHCKDICAQPEEYFRLCEQVLQLQQEICEQEALVETIAALIQEELNLSWMQRRKDEARSIQADSASNSEQFMEEERIKTQLDASLYIGLRLNADLEAIKGDLELSLQAGAAREKEMRDLLEEVSRMEMEEDEEDEKTRSHRRDEKESPEEGSEWARDLSKPEHVKDDDSDTGLSSLHSQDSDSLTVWESLV